MPFDCFQLTTEIEKSTVLLEAIESIAAGVSHPRSFVTSSEVLLQVPGAPFAYWVSQGIRNLFARFHPFETAAHRACITNPAGDDARYFRCFWEVPAGALGRLNRWVPIARGGRHNRFYNDVRQVVAWDESEHTYRGFVGTFHRPMKRPASLEHFFKPGLTWPLRSSIFSCQALPKGCIFSVSGKFATSDDNSDLPILLGLMNSAVFDFLIGFFAGKVGGVQYEVGLINKVPVPNLSCEIGEKIRTSSMLGYVEARKVNLAVETSHAFTMPGVLQVGGQGLVHRMLDWEQRVCISNRVCKSKCASLIIWRTFCTAWAMTTGC